MTTARKREQGRRYRLPDPPERNPDEVTSYGKVYRQGAPYHLSQHFGNPESTMRGSRPLDCP